MKRLLFLFASFAVLGCAVLFIADLEDQVEIEQTHQAVPLRQVTTVLTEITENSGKVSVFGEVKPRWQVDLRSRVAGVVKTVTPEALGGMRVKKDDVLLELETAHFEAGLEEARFALKNAEFELLKKQKKRDIALKDWRAVKPNIEPPDLAIHLPDVRVAEQSVAASKARVGAADYDLKSSVIRAPFGAIITKRSISPGQSVNEGDVLFTLLDDSKLDIRVALSPLEWTLLATDWRSLKAELFSETGRKIGLARMQRGGGFLDPGSRRYQVFLEVEPDAERSVLPGQFVRVELPGMLQLDTLKIPESAHTQNGFVWYVDSNDRLQRFEATALFRNNGEVVVRPPEVLLSEGELRVVVLPMSAYLPGQTISAIDREATR